MPLSRDEFTQQLTASGLLDAAAVAESLSSLPPERLPADGEALARELVRQKKLTKFQAEQLYAGKGKSLTLGNYVILDKLGQGGMGMVLKAEHKRMKRLVALKVMSPTAVKTPDALKRFHREVEAAAKLTHPNIVNAFDADEAKGTHFLVMEYVEGTDLSVLVKKHGPLPVEQAVQCIIQAARGLEFAHEQGVIHRDIKPANLLIDAKGTVKVLDMGLARIEGAVGGSSEGAGLTSTGTIMGTVDYMSPEQAMDTKHADARSDIYSLGCSLYYLLTGKCVYDGDTMMKKLMAHQNTPIPELAPAKGGRQPPGSSMSVDADDVMKTPGGLRPPFAAIDAVFRRMVAKRPEDRPQTMTQVMAELERCLSGGSPTIAIQPNSNTTTSGLSVGSGNELQDFLRQISGGESSTATSAAPSGTRGTVAAPSSVDAETMISSAGDGGTDPRTEQSLTLERSGSADAKRKKTLLLGSLAVAVVVLLAILFVVRGESGTLHLEITDDLTEVTIDETGRVVKGIADEEIRLALGEHVLHIKRDDLAFDTNAFEVTKGETVSIKVERVGRRVRAMSGKTLLGHKESSKSDAVVGSPPPSAKAPFGTQQARAHQEAWAKHLGVPIEYENTIGMKFVLIPPGEFTMGSTPAEIEEALKFFGEDKHSQDCIKSEAPQHNVILTQPIYLGIHEVTQAEYEQVMGTNPSYFAPLGAGKEVVAGIDTTRHPVEMVSWNDAAEFCTKLSEQEKRKPFKYELRGGETVTIAGTDYRLPTEAEWEYACHAGTTTKYWNSDKDEDLVRAGWFNANSGGRTHAVGELKPNPFGLFDIHGNAWEWVQDWWEPTYYGSFAVKPALDPNGPFSAGSQRVFRGGSWHYIASFCRASNRFAFGPADRTYNLGFRVALVVGASRPALKGTALPKPGATDPDRLAATYILSVGGTVQINEIPQDYTDVRELPKSKFRLTSIEIKDSQQISDAGLAACRGCQHLTRLSMTAAVGDAGLESFRECKKLKELVLFSGKVTDTGLAYFNGCLDLTSLSIIEGRLATDLGLANFKDCKKLEYLQLSRLQMTEKGIGHFRDCQNLQSLSIRNSTLGDAAFAELKNFPNLTMLDFANDRMTNAGLASLPNLKDLKLLILAGTQIDDAGVEHLKKLTKLTRLNLVLNKLTSAGLAELKKALPNCTIDSDIAP